MKPFIIALTAILFFFQSSKSQTIINPGFETGTLSGWTPWQPAGGGTPFIATSPHTGSYAAKLSGGICSIEQKVTGLKPWTRYSLSAWVRIADLGDSAKIGVKNYRDALATVVKATSTTYTKYTISFVTGGNNTSATIYFIISDAHVVTAVDDFTLAEDMPAAGEKYFVDNVSGNDNNSGHTSSLPWQTIGKVNSSVFFPGDSIFFKNGGSWTGTLRVQGEGNNGHPIVVSNYGTGSSKPLFNGNGALRTVYLVNQQYFEIANLEITNSAGSGSKKRGIEVSNTNRGVLYNINIHHNNVHDIAGDNEKGQNGSYGITLLVNKTGTNDVPSWFDNVRIENNIVKNVKRTGIGCSSDWRCNPQWGCLTGGGYYPIKNMAIRNNYVENAGGDGIVPIASYATLVEYNIVNGANVNSGTANAGIWAFAGISNVIQHNEVYNVKTAIDGEGYDVDFNQDSTAIQYNYSHDNEGGFMLLCTDTMGANTNATVRYNISQNDKYRLIMLNGPVLDAKIYNNTMYLPSGSTTGPIVVGNWGGTYPKNIYLKNNIFQLTSAGAWVNWGQITGSKTFDYNVIYGVHTAGEPSGTGNLTTDPLLVAPGTGTTGGLVSGILTFGNVDGYKLKAGSPAIGTGSAITTGSGGKDYWGNTVTSPPNIGAYNGPAINQLNALSFNGSLVSHTVQLQWQSENTDSVASFVVERSTNGKDYQEINKTPAKVHSSQYDDKDYNPVKGISYYRLKTIDKNNKLTFSEVVPINYRTELKDSLKCYPNPIRKGQALNYTFTSQINGSAKVYVRNTMGRNVYQNNRKVVKGKNMGSVSFSDLIQGTYVLIISNGDGLLTSKFIVE